MGSREGQDPKAGREGGARALQILLRPGLAELGSLIQGQLYPLHQDQQEGALAVVCKPALLEGHGSPARSPCPTTQRQLCKLSPRRSIGRTPLHPHLGAFTHITALPRFQQWWFGSSTQEAQIPPCSGIEETAPSKPGPKPSHHDAPHLVRR